MYAPVLDSSHLTVVYLVYTAGSLGLIVWLGRTLFRSGAVFLDDVFSENPRLAAAVNQLLVVGFYLLNLGYALLRLRADHDVASTVQGIEVLAQKLGTLMLALGVMHFVNLYVLHRIRRRSQLRLAPPPVKAQLFRNDAHV
ncbi:MAG TPA: hypothetical protein VK524_33435 [Polyangiaceae bacterium]|nr:hypothetical protein [Polyangiaceae bacterium]